MSTGETRADDDEGRHTTSHRELILLPGGGIVIDTPGLRELQLAENAAGLDAAFADVEELAAIAASTTARTRASPDAPCSPPSRTGTLAPERLESWRKLQRELHAIAIRKDDLLRKEETRRWKLLSREARARTRPR